jgi:hypothetical protein
LHAAAHLLPQVKKFAKTMGIRSVCVYGGGVVQAQISELKRGAEVVVCTPGLSLSLFLCNVIAITCFSISLIHLLSEFFAYFYIFPRHVLSNACILRFALCRPHDPI